MKTKKEAFEELLNKAKALNDNEYLHTTFGPMEAFTIERRDENFVLKVWDVYHRFEYAPRLEYKIENTLDIYLFIEHNPQYYAQNVFTGKNTHMDNWINFIEAFKVKTYQEDDNFKH